MESATDLAQVATRPTPGQIAATMFAPVPVAGSVAGPATGPGFGFEPFINGSSLFVWLPIVLLTGQDPVPIALMGGGLNMFGKYIVSNGINPFLTFGILGAVMGLILAMQTIYKSPRDKKARRYVLLWPPILAGFWMMINFCFSEILKA